MSTTTEPCDPTPAREKSAAFTLVELLAVMAVVAVLLALIVPAASAILRGSSITQSGQIIGDQLALARQSAVTSNRTVQVRFYQLPVPAFGSATSYCGMQAFRIEESGRTTPLSKMTVLRTNLMFAADAHSTLLAPPNASTPTVSGNEKLPAYNNTPCPYVGFQFLPNGSTDLDPTAANGVGGWYITLVEANRPVPTGQPTNFYTLRIDPTSGRTRLFRP